MGGWTLESSSRSSSKDAHWRELAMAIIEQAIQEALADPAECTTERVRREVTKRKEEALAFLRGATDDHFTVLHFWCQWAGFNTSAVAEHYRGLYAQQQTAAAA